MNLENVNNTRASHKFQNGTKYLGSKLSYDISFARDKIIGDKTILTDQPKKDDRNY